MESGWSQDGVRMESGWSLDGVWMESGWSLDGVEMESGWSQVNLFVLKPIGISSDFVRLSLKF